MSARELYTAMALAHVGARLIAGFTSVVVFLTPAHAVPAASAHASAIPLIVLVAIMVVSLRSKGGRPLVVERGNSTFFASRGPFWQQTRLCRRLFFANVF